jgi:hypothetical protein
MHILLVSAFSVFGFHISMGHLAFEHLYLSYLVGRLAIYIPQSFARTLKFYGFLMMKMVM